MEELNRHPDTAEVSTSNDAPEEYEPPEEALEQDDAELDSDFQEPEVMEEDEDEDEDEDIDSQELEAPAPEEPLEEASADAISEDPQPLTEVQEEPLEENISDEAPLTEVSDEAPLTEPEEAPVTEEPLTENLQDPDAQELPPPQEPENTPEPVSQSPDSLEDRELQEPVATEAQPATDSEERSAQDRMGDYLSEHNYGPDDYAEYSKDPEWQQLNNDLREELGMEPLSYERSAQDRMGDYLSEHNYGPDDYAEYSKDPEWQQLNNDLREELGMEPLSYERSAQDRMGDYLSEHNYGPDDYAEYSKDPEWQQLNNNLREELGMEPIDYSEKDGPYENPEISNETREALEPFKQENWDQLSPQMREEAIANLRDCIADDLGLENKPDIAYYNNPSKGDYGGYSPRTNTIHLNQYNLDDASETADTVSHESRHCWQHERANNPQNELDERFKQNFDNYIKPEENFERYLDQPVEQDARDFAAEVTDLISQPSNEKSAFSNDNRSYYADDLYQSANPRGPPQN